LEDVKGFLISHTDDGSKEDAKTSVISYNKLFIFTTHSQLRFALNSPSMFNHRFSSIYFF